MKESKNRRMRPRKADPLADLAKQINAEHDLCSKALRQGLQHALNAGRLLIQAKEQVPHGQWLPWLKSNVPFSERTAQAYMRIAKRWPELEAKAQRVADLPYRAAMNLLEEKKEPTLQEADEAFDLAVQASRKCFAELKRLLAKEDITVAECETIRDAAMELEAEWKALVVRKEVQLRETMRCMSAEERRRVPAEVWKQIRRLERRGDI